jgi:hypothetical protein
MVAANQETDSRAGNVLRREFVGIFANNEPGALSVRSLRAEKEAQ